MKNKTAILVCAVLLAVVPDVFAKKDDPVEVKKDLVLDLADSFFYSHGTFNPDPDGGQTNEGMIEFPDISFHTLQKSTLGDPDPAVDPGCPAGTFVSIPIQVTQIWHLDGDALSLDVDDSLTNAVCATGGAGTGVIINLIVTGGTGPFACASGNLSYNSVGAETPPELASLITSNGLVYNPTAKGKSVAPTAVRTGLITIPASCP